MTDAEAASLAIQAARAVFSGLDQRRADGSESLYVSRTGYVIRSSGRNRTWTSPEAYHAVMIATLTTQNMTSVEALTQALLDERASAGKRDLAERI